MTVLALLSVLVVFGTALWFIFSASESNRKYRWLQIVRRSDSQRRKRSKAGRSRR